MEDSKVRDEVEDLRGRVRIVENLDPIQLGLKLGLLKPCDQVPPEKITVESAD